MKPIEELSTLRKNELLSVKNKDVGEVNRQLNKIWDFKQAEILTIRPSPLRYYMEQEIEIETIESKLTDATNDEFIMLYKNYHHNFYKHNSQLIFYADGSAVSMIHLLFNDEFFSLFKEGAYYCKASSFAYIENYLVKDHYPNETEYQKAIYFLINNLRERFHEGSRLISFNFCNF